MSPEQSLQAGIDLKGTGSLGTICARTSSLARAHLSFTKGSLRFCNKDTIASNWKKNFYLWSIER